MKYEDPSCAYCPDTVRACRAGESTERGPGYCPTKVDPEGIDEARKLLPDSILYFDSIYEALHDADAVVLMTEWNQYRGLNLNKVKDTMKGNVFIDLRNVYEQDAMEKAGFDYHCVGR